MICMLSPPFFWQSPRCQYSHPDDEFVAINQTLIERVKLGNDLLAIVIGHVLAPAAETQDHLVESHPHMRRLAASIAVVSAEAHGDLGRFSGAVKTTMQGLQNRFSAVCVLTLQREQVKQRGLFGVGRLPS